MPGTRKFNLPTDQRKALLRGLVTNFLKTGKITTTLTRAKDTQALAEKISTLQVVVKMKAGEGGRAFGSISSKEIVTAFKEQHGIELDKKKIVLADALKNFGSYEVQVKLHPKVTGKFTVKVTES